MKSQREEIIGGVICALGFTGIIAAIIVFILKALEWI